MPDEMSVNEMKAQPVRPLLFKLCWCFCSWSGDVFGHYHIFFNSFFGILGAECVPYGLFYRSLMKVESIAECPLWSILQYF